MGPKEKDRGDGTSNGGSRQDKGGKNPSNDPYDDWGHMLLSAIAKIKYQKQRPNLERVTQTMRQLYCKSPQEVIHNLEIQVN